MAKTNRAISLGVASLAVIAIIIIVGLGVFINNVLIPTGTTHVSVSIGTTVIPGYSTLPTKSMETTQYYTTEASSNSSSGLRLDLFVAPSNGSVGVMVINVDEYNTLGVVNNISQASDWLYPQYLLNPFDNCGAPGPVGFAILQGYYDLNNFTAATALTLYNSTYAFTCTTFIQGNYQYSFSPNSNVAILTGAGYTFYNSSTLLAFSTKGYWTGGYGTGQNATFHNFPQGSYTVLAADEWGKVALVHIDIASGGGFVGTSTFATVSLPQGTTQTYCCESSVTLENWDPAQVANVTLYSPQVQAYINTAYSYDIAGMGPNSYGPMISVIINVTGSQIVVGNWSTGYTISYTGIKTLNATVQFTQPDTYELTDLQVSNLPNQTESITFSPQQQQVIQVALSNSTVQKLMGQSSYYVESVLQVPLANGTFAGDYFVSMYQISGTRTIGAFVNGAMSDVVDAYTDTRTMTFCYGSSVPDTCFTSPWNATS